MRKAILGAYYKAWGSGDVDAVVDFFTENAVFEDLAFDVKFEGKDGIRQFVLLTYSAIPDFSVAPTQIVVNGELAAAAWDMSGTHKGDFPSMPATGNTFTVRASSIIQFEDDKIISMTDYWNPIQFQKQVGLL